MRDCVRCMVPNTELKELRIIGKNEVRHRAFIDGEGNIYVVEQCNTDDIKERTVKSIEES